MNPVNRDRRESKASQVRRAIRENPDRKESPANRGRREFRDRRGNPVRKVLKVRVGNEENPARHSGSMRQERWKIVLCMMTRRRTSASWIPIPGVFS